MKSAILGVAGAAMTLSSIALHAQGRTQEQLQQGQLQQGQAQARPSDDVTAGSALDIPKDVVLFGKNDPNLRRPTAVVNGTIITGTDVDQRLALVVLANNNKVSEAERNNLRLQVLRNIIDETLQVQEARANDIKVPQAEIDENFARVAANFKNDPAGFEQYLKANGSSAATMKRQIEGELAWNRLLRRKVQPYVNVSEDEVKGMIDRMKESKGAEEFRIGEIYLSATPENGQQIADNGRRIVQQIKEGGSFQAYARQYSEASTAAVGGDLGWVRPTQLPDELVATVQQMSPGQIAGPVALSGGFSIVYLVDKRRVLMADPRDSTLSLKQIGVNFPAGTTPAQAKVIAERFAGQMKRIQGCGAANDVAKAAGADVVDNDGVKVRDLPPQLQNILLQLQVGQATPPFGAVSDGVRVLVLCGRDDATEGTLPSFEQVMGQMEEERVNKRARIYLRDLRRDAVIEYN